MQRRVALSSRNLRSQDCFDPHPYSTAQEAAVASPALTTPTRDGKKAKRLNFLEDFLIKHPSAVKRHRQSLKKRARNIETKSRLRTLIKRARQAIETKNQESAASQLRAVDKALGKAVSKGIIKGNTASRWLSRLSRSASQVSTGG